MSTNELEAVRAFWDSAAQDWQIQVGDDGDLNRRLNSDPVLWAFAGEVKDLRVLDAGCGTGYLTRKLADQGARVTGIDVSARMIELARARSPELDFRVDSCSTLATLEADEFDLIVSNYVLMDTPDLQGTMRSFHRVLRREGNAVLVFSHPCFPQGEASISEDGEQIDYRWKFSYFERRMRRDAPWAHFKDEFIWFHRPLSDYWKAFTQAGFRVLDFEEPRITEDRYHLIETEKRLKRNRSRPYSVAFKIQKV